MTRPYPFPESDAELWAYVRARVDAKPQVPLATIAEDLDLHVNDLVSWIMSYKDPARGRSEVRRRGNLPTMVAERVGRDRYSSSASAQRFANWCKQRAGAMEALRK